jgi:hypothetical protein
MSDRVKTKAAQARQHVEGGKRIIAAQLQLIGQIKAVGGDAKEAQSMLDSFRHTQATFENDVRLLAEEDKAAPSDSPSTPLIHIPFACPHCGQAGEIVWKDHGNGRTLVRLSSGFHVEEGRISGARHVIICNACDEIDPLRVYL